ncbi:hypothetical protein L2E82_26680 [Cichorium intybus]|uniref:Uncharacterized protein n=1 Tax=Cichorium intybus TaxID=13427 RepID=A0ACB9CR13_CICIN|nr:hypothetical protein L2E82_26680 [Cichorium intybus]
MEKRLLGYESIDLSTPNMPNELKLFLQRNQLPLGKDSRTGRERLTGSRGSPQFQGCGSQYTLTMVDSQFAFEPPSDEFIKKQEPSLSFQSVEINEYANNPETLLLEAIHSGGYSGALANPLLASECSLNRLNSSILEEFVDILMGRATEDVIVDVDLGREGECRISRRQSISAVKPLWRAAECWEENLKLLNIAETAIQTKESSFNNGELAQSSYGFIALTRGILRPAVSLKNIMNDFVWPVSSWNLKDLM